MQVTIRHRQALGGINGERPDHFVDCRVDFSEEEKAIIAARRLGPQYSLVLPPAFPQGSGIRPDGLGAGFLKFVGWVGLVLGGLMICASFGAIAAHDPAGFFLIMFGTLIAGAGIGAFVVRSRQSALHIASFEDQTVSLAQIVANPMFTIHAATRDLADAYAQEIREQLTLLKQGIMRHTEVRATETFEI